jgi:hypothetical protein
VGTVPASFEPLSGPVVWVVGRLVSTDVNVIGRAGTNTIYKENHI